MLYFLKLYLMFLVEYIEMNITFMDRFNDPASFLNSFVNIHDLFVNSPESRKYYLGLSYLNGDNYFLN